MKVALQMTLCTHRTAIFVIKPGKENYTHLTIWLLNTLADAFQQLGVSYLKHFLDDLITMGGSQSDKCLTNSSLLMATCDHLCFPMASDEDKHPSARI